jgi:AraC-like DNA-binding protein
MTFARAGVGRALHQFLARYPRTLSERVLQHAGVGPRQLANADEWLSHRAVVEALEIAAAESDDCAFGLAFAESAPWSELGALSYVIFNSPTIGTALGNGARYFRLQQTAARPALEVSDGDARLVYTLDSPGLGCHAQHSENVLAMVMRVCREGSGNPGWTPREIHFKHSRPASTAHAQQFFRCRILYDQPVDAVVMSPDDLRVGMKSADPALLPIILRAADEQLTKVPSAYDFADHVARIVMSSLSTGGVTIEYVASRLGSSPRTIQRRLHDRGLSFNDVVANTRLELSRRYLADPSLTLTDVAFLLGYSDLSAFSRAFRRWTGRTAIEFRRDQLRMPQPLVRHVTERDEGGERDAGTDEHVADDVDPA